MARLQAAAGPLASNPEGYVADPDFRLAEQQYDPAIPIADICEHPENYNRGEEGIIGRSLDTHGFYGAILVQRGTGRILAGNNRYRVARKKGAPSLPGFWLDVDDDQAREILAMDNKSSRESTFDNEALLGLLRAAQDSPRGLEGTGFEESEIDALVALLAGPGQQSEAERGPTLADRFLVAPFDVLDARSGWWQERKRHWVGLGLRSWEGRKAGLTYRLYEGKPARDPGRYNRKAAVERLLGHKLTTAEYTRKYDDKSMPPSSVFDPVLCELAYRWFSPAGGLVLDPFAGGSVRGLTAAVLGRAYRGYDLSDWQVAANREQAADWAERGLIGKGEVLAPFGPGDLTPVEPVGDMWVKRDDLFGIAGSGGGKVRSCWALATAAPKPEGLVTAGSRHSPQVNIVAGIARLLGIPCRVHVPAAAEQTPELLAAAAAGAEAVEWRPGHNSVIKARAAADAAERGWRLIPFGMECQEAIDQTASQVQGLPEGVKRIVVPVGSGMSLAGILAGLELAGLALPVLGVQVGASAAARLDKWSPGWQARAEIVKAELPYEHSAPQPEGWPALDPIYEAKCMPYLQPGDLLWCVGIRQTAAAPPAAAPEWVQQDATFAPLEPESADMVFTCPPYYDLEKYTDDPMDLSNMPTAQFDEVYSAILARFAAALKPDRFAVIVVGDARDKAGGLRDLRGVTIRAMEQAPGVRLVNGAILVTAVGSLPYTAGRLFTGTRTLGRTHQDVLVFCKGSRHEAAVACGPVDSALPSAPDPEGEEGLT